MSELDWYLEINLKARHLRLLVMIDTYRNLTQVADVTHVTVPAVSKSLAELEKGLGLVLFSRTARGLVPTPYGECLIRHARAMLMTLRQARDELKAMSSGSEGKLYVGMLPASAAVLLPQALSLLKQRSPGTNIVVTEGTTASLLPELWQGRLDLIVGRLPPPTDTHGSFDEKELLEEPLALMTGSHHPLASKKHVTWTDLQAYPWILPPPGSILRDPLERVLEAHDVTLTNNYIETLSVYVSRAQLQVSDFIAVMADSPANETQALHKLPLSLPKLLRPAGVLWNRNRGLTASAQLMVDCLEQAAQALMTPPSPALKSRANTPSRKK